MPDPVLVNNFSIGLHPHLHLEEMLDPALQQVRQGQQRRLAMVEVEHQIKVFAARPVELGLVGIQHIEVNTAQRNAFAPQQFPHAAKAG